MILLETLQKISTALDVSITDLNDDLDMLLSRSLKYYNAIKFISDIYNNVFNMIWRLYV